MQTEGKNGTREFCELANSPSLEFTRPCDFDESTRGTVNVSRVTTREPCDVKIETRYRVA